MCSCVRCVSSSQKCKISSESDCCGKCICTGQSYELAISSQEFNYIDNEIHCLHEKKLTISQKK